MSDRRLVASATRRDQIKSRQRVRDLAEVYTHKRELNAMLDLVPDMFPSAASPSNVDRKFLEPACGSGNFVEEILQRKLRYVTTRRFGSGERYEHTILRCLASIYAIDINQDNVDESRARLRAVINSHLDNDLNTKVVSPGFVDAVEAILASNVIRADTLADASRIRLVDYKPGPAGTFTREWSYLDPTANEPMLFSSLEASRDGKPIHYALFKSNPSPLGTEAQDLRNGT
jgi:SAM-dependent methyltransferase